MALENEWQTHEDKFNNDDILHRPTNEEYAFYTAVSHGDLETVRQNCESKRFTDLRGTGKLSRDALTNIKYHFVITVAMITRFCVDEGMEMELAV